MAAYNNYQLVENAILNNTETIKNDFMLLHERQKGMINKLENDFLLAIPEKIKNISVADFLNKFDGDINRAFDCLETIDLNLSQSLSNASTLAIQVAPKTFLTKDKQLSKDRQHPNTFLDHIPSKPNINNTVFNNHHLNNNINNSNNNNNNNNKSILKNSKRKRNEYEQSQKKLINSIYQNSQQSYANNKENYVQNVMSQTYNSSANKQLSNKNTSKKNANNNINNNYNNTFNNNGYDNMHQSQQTHHNQSQQQTASKSGSKQMWRF